MKILFYLLLSAFILIQFFPIDKTNPPVNRELDFLSLKNPPQEIAKMIRTSCYDCHSNETRYPWYSYLQPSGWFLQDHIKDGRRELNFSEFASSEKKRQIHKLEECAEQIENGEMPLQSFVLLHQDARLNAQQRKTLSQYFQNLAEKERNLNMAE